MIRRTLIAAMIAIGAGALSGCVAYEQPAPRYRDHGYRDRDHDRVPNRYDRDRDNDGVPNAYDRRPNDPRRY